MESGTYWLIMPLTPCCSVVLGTIAARATSANRRLTAEKNNKIYRRINDKSSTIVVEPAPLAIRFDVHKAEYVNSLA